MFHFSRAILFKLNMCIFQLICASVIEANS